VQAGEGWVKSVITRAVVLGFDINGDSDGHDSCFFTMEKTEQAHVFIKELRILYLF
jgi:hypothetical protein